MGQFGVNRWIGQTINTKPKACCLYDYKGDGTACLSSGLYVKAVDKTIRTQAPAESFRQEIKYLEYWVFF